MRKRLLALSIGIALAAMLAHAQTGADSQMARVVSIEKLASNAQHPEEGDHYKIAMRIGDTVYMCHASGSPAVFMGWSPNKEFPATLDAKGKTMMVKGPSDQVAELNIVGKKTPH